MGTSCCIAYKNEDGNIYAIQCSQDGYPEHMAGILLHWYNTYDKAKELVELGSLKYVGCYPETCIAYHRDLGESYIKPHTFKESAIMENVCFRFNMNYGYLFDGDKWTAWEVTPNNVIGINLMHYAQKGDPSDIEIQCPICKQNFDIIIDEGKLVATCKDDGFSISVDYKIGELQDAENRLRTAIRRIGYASVIEHLEREMGEDYD